METHAFGFRLRANASEGQKRFPIAARNNNITPIHAALSAAKTKSRLLIRVSVIGASGAEKQIQFWMVSSQRVPTIPIAQLMKECRIENIDILKVDIEGAEYDLFQHSAGLD